MTAGNIVTYNDIEIKRTVKRKKEKEEEKLRIDALEIKKKQDLRSGRQKTIDSGWE